MFWVQLILAANLGGSAPEIPTPPDTVAPITVEKSATGEAAMVLLRDELLAAFEDGFVVSDVSELRGKRTRTSIHFEGPENLSLVVFSGHKNQIERVEVQVSPTPSRQNLFMGLSEDSQHQLEQVRGVRSIRVEKDGRVVLGTTEGKVYLAEIIGC